MSRYNYSAFPPASAVGGPEERDELTSAISSFTRALRKHWVIALTITMVTVFAAMAYGFSQAKIYRATATIQVDPKPPNPLGRGMEDFVSESSGSYYSNLEYYNTQRELLTSKPIALTVVRELALHRDLSFIGNDIQVDKEKVAEVSEEDAAGILLSRLQATPIKDTRLVDVTFDDADRNRGVQVLEAVLRAYMAHNVNKYLESTSSAVDWLQEQLNDLRNELNASEIALHSYKLEKEIASIGLDSKVNLLATEMDQLNQAHTGVAAKIQRAAARVAQLAKISPDDPETIPQTELLASTALARLKGDYVDDIRERQGLLASGKGLSHPKVVAVQARIDTIKASLNAEIESIRQGAMRDLDALTHEAGGLRSLLKHAESQALDLNLMEIEYSRLQRTKDNNEKLYSLVLEQSKEAGLAQMLRANNISMFIAPSPGKVPVKPRLPLLFAAALIVGLGFGCSTAFLRERMDRSVKTPHELETQLGLTPLGVIPESGKVVATASGRARRRRGTSGTTLEKLVHSAPNSGFAEAFRTLRTNLLFMSPDRPFKRLLVTSPSPAEGKTTVACSLAIAIAQAGHRVILVDCDLRRPRLHQVFGESVVQGATLAETLLDSARLDAPKVLDTEIENVRILPAGPTPPNPSELLHSHAFGKLLDQLSAQCDVLILDSPPLVVTDAAILSTRVDGAILVLRSHQTDRSSAIHAIRAIQDVGGEVIGAVLNAMDGRKVGYGYGQRYGEYLGYKVGSNAA